MHQLHPPLPDHVLVQASLLPLKPDPVTLRGHRVRLVPLDVARDADALYAISNGSAIDHPDGTHPAYDADALVWRFMWHGPFSDMAGFTAYLNTIHADPTGLAFTVCSDSTGAPLGVAMLMSNVPQHLKIELGNIWYSPIAQRIGANTEATYLMLTLAFNLGYRRVEWKCNALNERSRAAALKMGFVFEGVQEAHMIVKGRNRDTAWFRILDHEWPDVRAMLEVRLSAPR